MKLLVTGGAGFIGSNFIQYILEHYSDCSVLNFDALTYSGNLENVSRWEKDSRYRFFKGDITDADAVDSVMIEADAVIHFAAESHVDRSILDPEAFVRTNVLGTYTLLESARKNGKKRFHHVSTDEVFGSLHRDDSPFSESTPYDPRSPYSASKAASDHLVRAYFHTYDLPVTISNCSNNYGPYHFPEKLIPLVITNLIEGKSVPIYGDGKQCRDWLFVDDHCRAIDTVLRSGKMGETYCIGGNSERENIWIVKKIIEILGESEEKIEYVRDRPGHDRRYAIDFSKIHRELGWQPLVDIDEGLQKTVRWFLDNELWWKHVKSGGYRDYYEKQYGRVERVISVENPI